MHSLHIQAGAENNWPVSCQWFATNPGGIINNSEKISSGFILKINNNLRGHKISYYNCH